MLYAKNHRPRFATRVGLNESDVQSFGAKRGAANNAAADREELEEIESSATVYCQNNHGIMNGKGANDHIKYLCKSTQPG